MEVDHRVGDEWPQLPSRFEVMRIDLAIIDGGGAERLENAVILPYFGLQLLRKQDRLHQVRHPEAGPSCFVPIGGPDATFRRADFRVTFAELALFVQGTVIWQNQMRAIADQQVFADVDAQLPQALNLGHKGDRIDDNAVADDASFPAAQNSRRDEMQNVLLALVDDSVTGVISALAADDDVRFRRQDIDDFAFPFVAPLRA